MSPLRFFRLQFASGKEDSHTAMMRKHRWKERCSQGFPHLLRKKRIVHGLSQDSEGQKRNKVLKDFICKYFEGRGIVGMSITKRSGVVRERKKRVMRSEGKGTGTGKGLALETRRCDV